MNLVQFKMIFLCSEKPICAPPGFCLSKCSQCCMPPLKQFQCSCSARLIDDDGYFWSFQGRHIQETCLRLSPPGDWWWDILGFVSALVSQAPQHFSSSEPQATCGKCFFRPVYPLGQFPGPLECPGQYIHGSLQMNMSNVDNLGLIIPIPFQVVARERG